MTVHVPHPGKVDWVLAEREIVPHLEPFASKALAAWACRRPEAVEPLKTAVTERIYRIKPEEVRPFLNPPMKQWPFRVGVRKRDWMLVEVENMTGGLPLALGFHRFVEANGRIPSWPEASAWFMEPAQRAIFYAPAWELYRSADNDYDSKYSRERWQMAIVWRIGNAYLSFLREMDFLSRMLHEHAIPLRMHILVDAVLKTDFWCGRHVICVYIPNDKRARKTPPDVALTGNIHNVEIGDGTSTVIENGVKRKLAWNEIKQAPEKELMRLAAAIREDRPMDRSHPPLPRVVLPRPLPPTALAPRAIARILPTQPAS